MKKSADAGMSLIIMQTKRLLHGRMGNIIGLQGSCRHLHAFCSRCIAQHHGCIDRYPRQNFALLPKIGSPPRQSRRTICSGSSACRIKRHAVRLKFRAVAPWDLVDSPQCCVWTLRLAARPAQLGGLGRLGRSSGGAPADARDSRQSPPAGRRTSVSSRSSTRLGSWLFKSCVDIFCIPLVIQMRIKFWIKTCIPYIAW